jgi:hypothetical protein
MVTRRSSDLTRVRSAPQPWAAAARSSTDLAQQPGSIGGDPTGFGWRIAVSGGATLRGLTQFSAPIHLATSANR